MEFLPSASTAVLPVTNPSATTITNAILPKILSPPSVTVPVPLINTFPDAIVIRPQLISTLIDTPATLCKEYSTPYSKLCDYCSYSFSDRPYPYPEPIQYFPRTREILPRGFFCMPNCVLAQIIYLNKGNKQGQQLEWFYMMMSDVYKIPNPRAIVASPPQRQLKNKNGTITKKQLRKLWTILPSLTVVTQNFLCRMTVIKEFVRDIEKGELKQQQFDFAKQLLQSQLKDKKRASHATHVSNVLALANSIPSATTAPTAVRGSNKNTNTKTKKRKRNISTGLHVPLNAQTSNGSKNFDTSKQTLVLDTADVSLNLNTFDASTPKQRRQNIAEQVLELSKVGNMDWFNVNQTLQKFPERKQEIVKNVLDEMEKEDFQYAKNDVKFSDVKMLSDKPLAALADALVAPLSNNRQRSDIKYPSKYSKIDTNLNENEEDVDERMEDSIDKNFESIDPDLEELDQELEEYE